MATMTFGDVAARQTIGRGVLRRAMARTMALREHHARRRVNVYLLGLDDATLATYGYSRSALEQAGRGAFPL